MANAYRVEALPDANILSCRSSGPMLWELRSLIFDDLRVAFLSFCCASQSSVNSRSELANAGFSSCQDDGFEG